MMEAKSSKRRWLALAASACFAVAMLAGASSALAVQSSQYQMFENPTSCPTGSPALNDPAFGEVACVANVANHANLKIGNLEAEVSAPTRSAFAIVPGNTALQPASCAAGEGSCFNAVPGSTTLEMAPIRIALPLRGHHGAPRLPSHGSFHGWHWGSWNGHGIHQRKLMHSFPEPSIEATPEAAGDLQSFTLALSPASPTPLFVLPLKIHLEGHLLGNDCYIGSNTDPIVFAPFPLSEPELGFLSDPNGLPPITLTLSGLDTGSNMFAVPAASGCGPAVGFGKHKTHPLDAVVNAMLGLPSPAGENALVLTDSKGGLVVSTNGGAELQAAFEAAKAP